MLINIENLSFSYGINEIFNQLSLSIQEKEMIGLVGRNGSGKSTFLKLLSGQLTPDSGIISKKSNLTIGYLAQEADFPADTTLDALFLSVFEPLIKLEERLRELEHQIGETDGAEQEKVMKTYGELQDRFAEQKGYEYPSRIRGIAKGLGFTDEDMAKPFGVLSGGEKTRAALGRNLLQEPELLLLDEPTNYLDIDSLQWLEQFLKAYDGAFVIISHDRYFLDKVCGRILEVSRHSLDSYSGNYTTYVEKKEKLLMDLDHQYAQQMREIKRQQEMIARFRRYNSVHSSKRAASREKALAKMEVVEKVQTESDAHFNFKPRIQSGKDVLTVRDVSKSFDGQSLFENISFDIHRGDKVGIIGANGIGKTTLFRIIQDKVSRDSGVIEYGHKVHVGYYDQENNDLKQFYDKNLLEALWDIDMHFTEGELRCILAAFLFTGDDVFKAVSSLSGGEKARLLLARLMLSQSNFLLMDEPTNHIDMRTKEILENALIAYQGTLLFISHDRYFLNRVATKIYNFTPTGIEVTLGNYDDYIHYKDEAALREALEAEKNRTVITKTRQKADRKKQKEQEAAFRGKKKELKTVEADIEHLENEIADYEAQMCQNDFYDDLNNVNAVTAAYNTAREAVASLTERWEELLLEIEEWEEQ
ncbi:putative ABC transporter ATP-binding protein YbiT [Eubacterium callanderi]|uniref:ABC-F family ATP-binding cassette domain-containing protein n=1 Tax=Eubacterium callanderi TaxID=53442 RepID=UPI0029FED11C|nr:ABC-F family ATP-binding cassette domain-containing protein [Eubacterium callanderi]WPK66704.1 putative ABC transporter ATP-binding protein YbiT [Eubacterium callanderi]WPK71002.1 putative ABC transporter ATP-binding protein YbiT [Eubacterium callanderi]